MELNVSFGLSKNKKENNNKRKKVERMENKIK